MADYKYIFGPVPSRRLGRSLGVDLIPYKTCTYNCIYCQIGDTSDKTIRRAEYVPGPEVIKELGLAFAENRDIDFVTFSGSGEPTLNSSLGKIIRKVKKSFKTPVAVITNGSLLWMKDVQKNLLEADIVLPTLSSVNAQTFAKIHRPAPGISLSKIISGIIDFRKVYKGQLWLEVFIVRGINDNEKEMKALKLVIDRFGPEKIQLNTSVRIPSEEYSLSVAEKEMDKLAHFLGKRAEIIADFKRKNRTKKTQVSKEDILNYLRRRPGTAEDLSVGLNTDMSKVKTIIQDLLSHGRVSSRKWQEREEYFFVN